MKVTQGMVWQWVSGRRRVSAEQVRPMELATDGKVTGHDVRPDLYPRQDAA